MEQVNWYLDIFNGENAIEVRGDRHLSAVVKRTRYYYIFISIFIFPVSWNKKTVEN